MNFNKQKCKVLCLGWNNLMVGIRGVEEGTGQELTGWVAALTKRIRRLGGHQVEKE